MNKNSNCKKELGQYYTIFNPFNNDAFISWLNNANLLKNDVILEPFAGSNNIVNMIKNIGINNNWACFDINDKIENKCKECPIKKLDTIKNFPKGYKMCITNPPYLSKVSASFKKLNYPNTNFDDLYKLCLSLMLENCEYVAAIIPESFITANIFHERLEAIISLNIEMFEDTTCPVCLALFIPIKSDNNFKIYKNNLFIGDYFSLKKYNLSEYINSNKEIV